MSANDPGPRDPRREIAELRRELREAENTIEALLAGEIDTVAASSDDRAQLLLQRAQAELRASERALRESTELLRTVLENLPVGVWVVDGDGDLQLDNREARRIWGGLRRVGEEPPRRGRWADTHEWIPDDDWPLARALDHGESVREAAIELQPVGEERRKIVTLQSATPITDEDGAVVGAVGVSQDVTESRQLQEKLQQTQKMEAVGQLAGGIAHEFNNLLTAILGHAELLSQTLDDGDPGQEDVSVIRKSGSRAADLTRQLLAYGRRQISQPQALDPRCVLEGLEPLLRRSLGEQIEVEIEVDADVKPVRADPSQLEQVIIALAVNARDAMPEGGRLSLRARDLSTDEVRGEHAADEKNFVALEVEDTGTGMDEETQARIFDPFFTTKDQGEGTGLGLSTVQGIVEQAGGHVRLRSAPGKGSKFTLLLPAAGPESRPVASMEKGPKSSPAHTRTILVAEDEELVRDLICRALERTGHVVLDADTPDAALEIATAREEPLDLLITDVVMPGMKGPELARKLRDRHAELGVLFISGYADDERLQSELPDNAVFLSKPMTPAALLSKVSKLLDPD